MEYIDGVKISEITKIKSEYSYHKYVALLSLFIFNCGLNSKGLLHGDLHSGNYLVDADNFKLTILDFGYCYKIDSVKFKILFNLFNNPSEDNITEFINDILNSPYNKNKKETIISNYDQLFTTISNFNNSSDIVLELIKFTNQYKLIVPNEFLNTLLLFLQLSDVIEKSNLYNKNSNNHSFLMDICEIYDICHDFNNYMKLIRKKDTNNKKDINSQNNKFNKFENLKKYL